MLRLIEALEVVYKKLHNEAWDNCYILSGDEGTGKTNLALNIMEWWNLKKYGVVKPEDINRLGMSPQAFALGLKNAVKGDIVDYDESGELSNKTQLNRFNMLITTSYQVIRNERLFTLLTIPNLFDLNPFFTKRRARGLIYVYKRGKFGFWNRPRLRALLDLNANRFRKSVFLVKPLFYDTYPIYNGKLLESYETMKNEHTKRIKELIYTKLLESEKPDKLTEVLIRAKELIGTTKTAEVFNLSKTTVIKRAKLYKNSYQDNILTNGEESDETDDN